MKTLQEMTIKELREEAKALGIKNYANFKKAEYIQKIEEAKNQTDQMNSDRPEVKPKKETPEDITTAADIASEFGFRPQKVRRILRKAGLTKTDKSWIWDTKKDAREITEIKKLLENFTEKEEA